MTTELTDAQRIAIARQHLSDAHDKIKLSEKELVRCEQTESVTLALLRIEVAKAGTRKAGEALED